MGSGLTRLCGDKVAMAAWRCRESSKWSTGDHAVVMEVSCNEKMRRRMMVLMMIEMVVVMIEMMISSYLSLSYVSNQ